MKKTLIFPRLHKIPRPPRINFGIFKPVTRISGKKSKSVHIKKSQEKADQRPKYEEKNYILKENYSFVEAQNSYRKSKEQNIFILKPKNLYDKLVLEKLKPNFEKGDNDSSSSNYNFEEKKINENKINKIKIFPNCNDKTTFFTKKNSASNEYKSKNDKKSEIKRKIKKKIEKKNSIYRNNVQFINTKDNKRLAEKYLEEIVHKNEFFFEKDFIDKNIFNYINKEIFIQRLLFEMNKKKEEIPLYLYEDDSYIQELFEEITFDIILDNLDRNRYLPNRNQVIFPEIVNYHNYLNDFINMYNSIGGKLYLDELYNDDIYIKNKSIKEEEEEIIKENKKIKNIIKSKKLKILSEKFKNYLKKKEKKLSTISNTKSENNSKEIETSFNSKISFKENYLNIISNVLKNRKKFYLKYGNNKYRRIKKLSIEQSELISIEKMLGGRLRISQNKEGIFQNDDKFEINKHKKRNKKPISILKDSKYKWYTNEYSFLDCPDFYEKPKRKNIFVEEINGLIFENKINNKKRDKNNKSIYNKFFKNKFKLYK